MASRDPSTSNFPAAMGPGARPLQPGEQPGGSLLQEISAVRSTYSTHVENRAVNLGYMLNDRQRMYRLPFDKIPVQGLSEKLCYGSPNSATVTGTLVIDMIRGCENITGQPVTQTEAEGLAFYGTRRMMTMYVGQTTGIAIGAFAAWRTRKAFKFPFRSAKGPEKYENFPGRALPILRGGFARLMWQITRYNVYIFLWLFVTSPFFRSVADTRMTVGLYADPRTHDLTTAIKGNFDRLRSNRAQEAANRAKGIPSSQQPSPSNDSQAPDENSPQSFYGAQSSSGDNYAGDTSYTDGNTDTGLITDAAISRRETRSASPNSWSEAQSRGSRSDQSPQSSSQSSDFFFDDASPTAGNDPNMGTPQPYTQQSGPGSWDRLRRGGSPQSGLPSARQTTTRSAPTRDTPDFETKSDSFSFSNSEEERRLAKDQAQKEFDAMLEKERNDGGSADYARGMKATEAGSESGPSADSGSAWSRRRGT